MTFDESSALCAQHPARAEASAAVEAAPAPKAVPVSRRKLQAEKRRAQGDRLVTAADEDLGCLTRAVSQRFCHHRDALA